MGTRYQALMWEGIILSLYAVLALAFALSADAFSFSLGLGMTGVTRKQVFRISLTVLVFHVIMPLAGYVVGGVTGTFLGKWASIVGALILVLLGLRMIWEGFSNKGEDFSRYILTNTYGIMLLGLTVSLDALSVGFTLGTQKVALGFAATVIGLVAGTMTFIGLGFGKKVGEWLGRRAVVGGGLVLVYIGINLFL